MNKQEFMEITKLLEINYSKELDIKILEIWYEKLKEYPKARYEEVIKQIIKKSKFMPTIAEILETCKKNEMSYKISIVEKMKADGYFFSECELDKTYKFIEKGIIPNWLINDMKNYGYVE